MNTPIWTTLAATALYLAAAALMARQLVDRRGNPRAGMMLLGALAVICHGAALWPLLITPAGIQLGLFPVLSLVGATGAALVVISCLWRPLEWISILVFPLAAATLPLALWIEAGEAASALDHGLGAHVLLSILAYAVFAVAAAHAVLMSVQHRQLKDGHIRGLMRVFPPVQVMEIMLFEMIWLGMALLFAAIVTGFIYVDDLFAQHLVHKTVLSLVALVVYGVLLAGRHLFGWRARTAVRMTLAGFALLVLAFFGSQLVLEYILERTG
jgi:ABC-type uncharacterized transport system permease subunit